MAHLYMQPKCENLQPSVQPNLCLICGNRVNKDDNDDKVYPIKKE